MAMKICSSKLTTCGFAADGGSVTLGFVDDADTEMTLQLSFFQAEAVAMTLPHLLTQALKSRTGDASARYVFPLGRWTIEQSAEPGVLIFSLTTDDGFSVSFGIPREACGGLAWSLAQEADGADEPKDAGDAQRPLRAPELH
jgi:hypothetical protein